MFLAWRIMDALRANIMRFYSAIHIKHRKQQKARVEGRSAIKMPASKHIISTPPSHACVHHATLPISVRTVDSRRPIIIPRIIFRHFERKKERESYLTLRENTAMHKYTVSIPSLALLRYKSITVVVNLSHVLSPIKTPPKHYDFIYLFLSFFLIETFPFRSFDPE